MTREWDAASYDALPLPHVRWGRHAIERLQLSGQERVLDAGCGTGRVTEQLLERLPDGRVIALDGSQAMLDQLRLRLAHQMDRVEVIHADLTKPLPLDEPVDAILSTATFHWISDHATLFSHLANVLRPGGQLVVDCGGAGNIASVNAALASLGHNQSGIWNFAGPEETRERLGTAGFTDIRVWLEPDPVHLPSGEAFAAYLATVVLGAHLDTMSPEDRSEFVRAVAALLPNAVVDYVRLNIVARKME